MKKGQFNKDFWLEEAQKVGQLGYYLYDVFNDIWESSKVLDDIMGIGTDYPKNCDGWLKLIHSEEREEMKTYLEYLIGTGEDFNKQYRIIQQATGEERWLHGHGKFYRDTEQLYLVGTIQDVTDSMELTISLDQTRQRYTQLFENSPIAIVVHMNGIIHMANPCACKLLTGLDDKMVLGRTLLSFIHPDYAEIAKRRLSAVAFPSETANWIHQKIIRDDQTIRDVEIMSMPVIFGNDHAVQTVIEDITDQIRIEEDLMNSERRFRKIASELEHKQSLLHSLIDSIPDLIFYKDPNGVYLGCNKAFEIFCGCKESQLTGLSDTDLFSKEQADFFKTMDQLTLTKKNTHRTDTWVTYPDGQKIFLETLKTPYYDPDGTLLGLIGISRDVTKRYEQEELMEKARSIAERANSAKSEFIANMSHEIRTPLNVIIGLSEFMTAELPDSDMLTCAQTIEKAGNSLLTLINDVLDLSKIEAGMMTIEKYPVNLKNLIKDILQIFQLDKRDKLIDLIIDEKTPLPQWVLLDETRIRQVLLNIIGNAVKFTEEGHVSITLEAHESTPEIWDVIISVTDTGIGIKPEELSRIFDPFVQQNNQDYEKYRGTGLGLSITKKLLSLMDGSIAVSSILGEGSTFTITLKQLVEVDHTQEIVIEKKLSDIHFKPATVLIADDVESSRGVLSRMLNNKGLELIYACNGFDALKQARRHLPDLMMLDIRMPLLNGFEVIKLLKSEDKTQHIPIILYSATPYDTQTIETAGFSGALIKPLTIQKLMEVVSQFLEKESHSFKTV